jgi:hypothetical protein
MLAQDLVGMARVQGLDGLLDFELERDGCPWGWAQSRYVQELSSFVGTRGVDSATRSPSLRLLRRMTMDEREPIELLDAVRETEAWEDGAWAYFAGRVRAAQG